VSALCDWQVCSDTDTTSAGERVGRTVLYFGCRHRKEDFLYEQEVLEWTNQGLELHTAFSRETVT
jgi:sulfite reductase alpha subunit-like flavoprotein